MNFIEAIILGLVQGLTEFIPVSSSGHLIVFRSLLGLSSESSLMFDVFLHVATSFAVVLYFYKDILRLLKSLFLMAGGGEVPRPDKVLIFAIVLGTIPAALVGIFFEDSIEELFRDAKLVAAALLLGSVLFWFAEKKASQDKTLTIKKGVLVGFFQVLALIPGTSRSGSTISGGLLLGLKREEAARFSFLLALPVIFGAGTLKLFELLSVDVSPDSLVMVFCGSIVAFFSGLFAIHYLLKFLKNHTLTVFVWYRILLALCILIFL